MQDGWLACALKKSRRKSVRRFGGAERTNNIPRIPPTVNVLLRRLRLLRMDCGGVFVFFLPSVRSLSIPLLHAPFLFMFCFSFLFAQAGVHRMSAAVVGDALRVASREFLRESQASLLRRSSLALEVTAAPDTGCGLWGEGAMDGALVRMLWVCCSGQEPRQRN